MILHAQLPERQVSILGPAFNELGKGSFTQSDSVTVTNVTLTGKLVYNPFSLSQCPSKRSKVPPVNVTVTVTEWFGVNRRHRPVDVSPTRLRMLCVCACMRACL